MPHRWIARRARLIGPHLGRRGAILATLGTLWVLTGIATVLTPDPTAAYPLLSIGHELRAAAWITTGILAIIAAHRAQGRDALGWASLYVMAAYRLAAYTHGLLLWVAGADGASPRAVFGVASWLALVVVIRVCSGWPEHPDDPATTGQPPAITHGR